MKFYFRKFVYHWLMTGFVGKDGRWFLGYSSRPEFVSPSQLADFLIKNGAGVSFDLDLTETKEGK